MPMIAQFISLYQKKRQGFSLALAFFLASISLGSFQFFAQSQQAAPMPSEASSSISKSTPSKFESDSVVNLADFSKPKKLSIPSIGVSSDVIELGKTSEGSIEVPEGKDYDKAAWYKHSPTPGQAGASIIEGHIDSVHTGPSVFFRLGELKAGDKFTVLRSDNKTLEFSVTGVDIYQKNKFPSELIYGTKGSKPVLKLITCGGGFNISAGEYDSNIVVTAELLEQTEVK